VTLGKKKAFSLAGMSGAHPAYSGAQKAGRFDPLRFKGKDRKHDFSASQAGGVGDRHCRVSFLTQRKGRG